MNWGKACACARRVYVVVFKVVVAGGASWLASTYKVVDVDVDVFFRKPQEKEFSAEKNAAQSADWKVVGEGGTAAAAAAHPSPP